MVEEAKCETRRRPAWCRDAVLEVGADLRVRPLANPGVTLWDTLFPTRNRAAGDRENMGVRPYDGDAAAGG